ncbi:MAG: hypothetical protein A2817_01170 [Candidatus Yanofskybacteria bacterium RIFCSPHIGHO2_01_FULL_39_8b]|uniref:NAD-dependent epimerase/dehydratase domain-containing protein n=1 Tax=Candidatus Yanofskybacteria bacterium RIFCSPHIGHO2_01_FULL_39_8b TaxID=1802659 RepID=A0A1F8EHK8_9BACT|nr:hypothetical protein [uncultured bacterium]OGM99548.1 MAG: hypothetical protein A2817_01170 [Candidatus Yanofskybacteria bacterium RIFCSPHIGHO2_01_FULL_39_8b]
MNKKQKIGIFGGNGFIGSWLVNLLKKDFSISTFDIQKKFSDYNPKRAATILKFRKKLLAGAKQYKGDVQDLKQVREYLEKENPDIIVCLSSIPLENFERTLQLPTEIVGISNILYANEARKARVVYMSSLFAIGHFDHAVTEMTHLAPVTNYGIGKATGEHLVRAFGNNNYGIIRTTSVYGPGDINNRVPQIILEKAITNSGNFWINKASLLDFIYVKDLIEGIKKVIFHERAETFNISGGKALTLVDFINTIESLTGKKLDYEIRHLDDRTRRGTLVNDKARLILNWQPKYNLKTGIEDTLDTYKKSILI